MTLKSLLPSWNIQHKTIFLRADFNVPLDKGKILNDFRLQATLPTIDFCLKQGARLIIATHIGRPKGYDQSLSTQCLIPWFEKNGYAISLAKNISEARQMASHDGMVLLENLRFWPEEKAGDKTFAQQLAEQADFFVQDAFGCLHRHDTSIALLPEEFSPSTRTIGFLVEKELTHLYPVRTNPKKPFMLIVGGGKVADKLPLLAQMEHADTFCIGPALSNTFLAAQGISVGSGPVDEKAIDDVKQFIEKNTAAGKKIILPEDVVVAKESLFGPLRSCLISEIEKDEMAVSFGPKTAQTIAAEIHNAGTVLYNGLMGTAARPETLAGAQAVFTAMAESTACTVIAGGDSIAAAQELGLADKISYLSTGGGATLTYVSGAELPGLKPFESSFALRAPADANGV